MGITNSEQHNRHYADLDLIAGNYQSPVRDLAKQLRDVARAHMAFSQVYDIMNVLDSHLSAIAFAEETNRREAKLPKKFQETKYFVAKMADMARQHEHAEKIVAGWIEELKARGYVYDQATDCWEKHDDSEVKS